MHRVSSEFEYLPVGARAILAPPLVESGCRSNLLRVCARTRVRPAGGGRRKRVRDGETGNYEG